MSILIVVKFASCPCICQSHVSASMLVGVFPFALTNSYEKALEFRKIILFGSAHLCSTVITQLSINGVWFLDLRWQSKEHQTRSQRAEQNKTLGE